MYRVVRCPNCALLQMTSSNKSLKCVKCNKSKVISYIRVYFTSENPQDCTQVIKKMKEEQAKKLERPEGFFSYKSF